jgi:hypothetical protein
MERRPSRSNEILPERNGPAFDASSDTVVAVRPTGCVSMGDQEIHCHSLLQRVPRTRIASIAGLLDRGGAFNMLTNVSSFQNVNDHCE